MAGIDRITFEPDPPVAESNLIICYDFTGSGISSTELRVRFTPEVVPDADYPVSSSEPCVTIAVPHAETIDVEDLSGVSPSRRETIDN